MASDREIKAKQLANDLLDFVNSCAVDGDIFSDTICRGHRTLQQSVMRLFVQLCRKMATVNNYDERNASAVRLAQKISELSDDYTLPYI